MTNLEKWRFYMKEIVSPDSFIDMGFYYLISSSLQRRVWVGSTESPLFPNQYIILVGDPGVGKTLVTKPIKDILKFHKLPKKSTQQQLREVDGVDPRLIEQAIQAQQELEKQKTELGLKDWREEKKQEKLLSEDQQLFPIAPDSTTFESLVQSNANLISGIRVAPCVFAPNGFYRHNSLSFILTEVSSIFKKKTEDVIDYLIAAYDCDDYTYCTKHQGTDRVRKCCLNILGGTTPDFVAETFSNRLLTQGFASRAIFVFECANRFNRFIIPDYSAEQLKAKYDIIDHVRQLSTLFGQVSYTPEAYEILRYYFEEVFPDEKGKADPKLLSYLARKNIHVQKMAMAIHFGESLEMFINADEVTLSLRLLARLEENMHFALNFGHRNPLSPIASKIIKFLEKSSPATIQDIWRRYFESLRLQEIEEVLLFLETTGAVVKIRTGKPDEKGRELIYYSIVKKTKNEPGSV